MTPLCQAMRELKAAMMHGGDALMLRARAQTVLYAWEDFQERLAVNQAHIGSPQPSVFSDEWQHMRQREMDSGGASGAPAMPSKRGPG
jgi:hypothetical protein